MRSTRFQLLAIILNVILFFGHAALADESGEERRREIVKDSPMMKKLKNIVIDHVEFDEATLESVLVHLNGLSKQLDRDTPRTGVPIILNLSREKRKNMLRVTLEFDQIPMLELLKYICGATNLKYRVEKKAVIVTDQPVDKMEIRTYKVRPGTLRSLL